MRTEGTANQVNRFVHITMVGRLVYGGRIHLSQCCILTKENTRGAYIYLLVGILVLLLKTTATLSGRAL